MLKLRDRALFLKKKITPSPHYANYAYEAIFLATCLATMTTEKYCKLQRGWHTFSIFFATCNVPGGNVYNSFSASLKSPASKRRALID